MHRCFLFRIKELSPSDSADAIQTAYTDFAHHFAKINLVSKC